MSSRAHARSALRRRGASGSVIAMLMLLLMATLGVSSTAANGAVSIVSTRVFAAVGDLSHSSGAGNRTWGLRDHAAWSTRVINHRRDVTSTHGYRASSGDHGLGLAADLMVRSAAQGNRLARFARKHRRQLNISYVIWYQRIWSVERAREGWRPMADAGSVTANHRDHVHVSYRSTPTNSTYRR